VTFTPPAVAADPRRRPFHRRRVFATLGDMPRTLFLRGLGVACAIVGLTVALAWNPTTCVNECAGLPDSVSRKRALRSASYVL
jgi:hypothetical protein